MEAPHFFCIVRLRQPCLKCLTEWKMFLRVANFLRTSQRDKFSRFVALAQVVWHRKLSTALA